VIVRGVEQFFWNEGWLAPWFVTEIGKAGANTVRILPLIDGNADGRPPLSLAQMENLIQLGIQGRMLVDVAVNGGKTPDTYLRSDVKTILQRYERNIVIHAVGEAYESTGLAWATRVKGVIGRLRAAGYKAPLYIMSIDGGRNLPAILQYGAEILASDPLKNVVFGWQAYWGQSSYYQTKYGMTLTQAMQSVRDASVPIQVGAAKVGDYIDGAVNYLPILADARTYGIGWLWWDWRMSDGNLTTDGFNGHWAPGGQAVAVTDPASIANTSVRTYFQRNNACPPT
jgi:mannan endo-1,4-beta-mannosidase